jgi:hypothetical protein
MKMLRSFVGYLLIAAMVFGAAPIIAGRTQVNRKYRNKKTAQSTCSTSSQHKDKEK